MILVIYKTGLLNEIATLFYHLDTISVKVLESKNDTPGGTTGPIQLDAKTVVVKYRLDFDNRDYVSPRRHHTYTRTYFNYQIDYN